MWVVDGEFMTTDNRKKLFAYKRELGAGETEANRHNSGKDIELDSDNAKPQWIWSDGVTMWVSDNNTITNIVNGQTNTYQKIYAYDLVVKTRSRTKDINLDPLAQSNAEPQGLWSDGENLWVSNGGDNPKIYAYKLAVAEGELDCWAETQDFNTLKAAKNLHPKGIFSDRSTMYVVDADKKKIFAYNQPLSANNNLKSLALSNVYEGAQLLEEVFESSKTAYFAYVLYSTEVTTVTAAAQDPDAGVVVTKPADANLAAPGHQVHLPKESTTEIVITVTAENAAVKGYIVKVDRRSGWHTPINDVVLHMDNSSPRGLWINTDETKIWVVDDSEDKIYAYALDTENKDHLPGDSFPSALKDAGNEDPKDIWSDGITMWVSDEVDNRIYAYKMSDKTRDLGKEIALDYRSAKPRGLWANNTNMWVAAETEKALYAFNMWTTNVPPVWDGSRKADEELIGGKDENDVFIFGPLESAGNKNPHGLWSDGETIWVANIDPGNPGHEIPARYRFFAYDLDGKTRQSGKDISELAIGKDNDNNLIKLPYHAFRGGFWLGERTMWVSGYDSEGRIYTFNRPRPGGCPPIRRLRGFHLENLALERSGIESRLFP